MQFRRSVGVGGVLVGGLLLTAVVLGGVVWFHPEWLGMAAGSARQTFWLSVIAAAALVVVTLLGSYRLLWRQQGLSAYRLQYADEGLQPRQVSLPPPAEARTAQKFAALDAQMRHRYGFFWRRKVRLLLVVGEPAQIDAIAPGLIEAQPWLEGQNTVLLWGGSLTGAPGESLIEQWRQLCRWRGLDGVVWTLDKAQSADVAVMGAGVRRLQDLARGGGWQLPLHLWQVCDSAWPQATRKTQPVGCRLPPQLTEQDLQTHLDPLLDPLRSTGLEQMQGDMGHDFLLRLSRDLQVEGIARWRQALAPWLNEFARGVPLRGLWFSLPLQRGSVLLQHDWLADPAWGGVLGDHNATARRVGWSAPRIGYALMLGLAAVWGAGLLLSFTSNRAQIAEIQTSLATLQQAEPGEAQRLALSEWVLQLGRLDYRAEHGAPWYQRFGLNQNRALLDALWPHYVEVTHRLLRDPAAANLTAQLNALIKLPPDSPERAKRSGEAYDQLKAYLMLANPEKADAAFLVKVLGHAEPDMWQFYAEQLPTHPQWRLEADPKLVAQARQVLLGQLGQRNAEASLYQQVLDSTASHYPALRLQQMLGDSGGMALFSTTASVPGVFTRQAWEGQVRQAIDKIAEARREEVDWVLSDNPASLAVELSPDVLRERLTARYFQDYSGAWLDFLGSLRWHPADSLGDVIDQLTLMSDVRQSPLIALMNTLAYQGQAGSRRQALADSLLQSAQQLIAQDKVPAIEQQMQGPSGPLDATFGPLLTLLGSASEDKTGNDSLSLQAFLTQVTRVRLTLQQVSTAPDPQAMTQALAQTVFQGKNVDLTETQAYGNLLAASLGAEWGGIGQTLFVQPLEQAWQRVLQPSAASLNRQWQRAIVSHWQSAFASRYPFAATPSDASLPMLGQMIRADSGRIEQFLQQQLGGVLRKEGDRWVADPRHSQGLRFNPQFLTAINQLSHLADVLYTDGGMGLSFELRGKPVRDVVETIFVLNGEKHHYFNQKESWQRFAWPGRSDRPGVSLTWTSVRTGARLFGDYEGTWGLIRLLEQAQVTPLDDADSRYRLVLKAPDGLGLTWHLRTELGAGPLALLKLRGFKLPSQIFLAEGGKNGGFE
ncbi:ImcF-related family protein [Pseudomonas akapageensis]|uniref:ImcF-related family protein n=1 Tax=Pseudomonas akapageensis TaxID=2609961 RepID=UPI00140CED3F|nr:ImcF-related family protein [Pseudomonas akapageensis]